MQHHPLVVPRSHVSWCLPPARGPAARTLVTPAGSSLAWQVRNLSSCVKVALDFVSPENAHRCVTLTNQFAKLPRGHHLSEDKLQVKTMLLHAMKHMLAQKKSNGIKVSVLGLSISQATFSDGPAGRDAPSWLKQR